MNRLLLSVSMKHCCFLIIILMAVLSSCTEGEVPQTPAPPSASEEEPPAVQASIRLTDSSGNSLSSFSFGGCASDTTFFLESTVDWKVKDLPSWLSLSALNGAAGRFELKLSSSANLTASERKYIITFVGSSSGSRLSQLTVSQEMKLPDFEVSSIPDDPKTAFASGGSTTVSFMAQGHWTATSDSPWLVVSPESGEGGGNVILTLTAKPNQGISDRTGYVVITSDEGDAGVSITQRQNPFIKTPFISGTYRNSAKLTYGNKNAIDRVEVVFPYIESNEYQSVVTTSMTPGSYLTSTTPGGVKYMRKVLRGSFPESGSEIVYQTITCTVYNVRTDFTKIKDDNMPYDKESDEYKRFTSAYKNSAGIYTVNPNHSEISRIADRLWEEAGGNRINYALKCYEYVADNIEYAYAVTSSIDKIMHDKKGDCGNQHSVWISLLRNKGIPARPILMVSPLHEDWTHMRAEFYIPGYGWIPVDVTEHQANGNNFFGVYSGELVVMNRDMCFNIEGVSDSICELLQIVAWWYYLKRDTNVDLEISFREF